MIDPTDYIVCPVRNAPEEVKDILDSYVASLEACGRRAHYPPRDVDQDSDPTGLEILRKHQDEMRKCSLVHVYWTGKSEGSFYDLGMAAMLQLPVVLINRSDVNEMAAAPGKTFSKVLLLLDEEARQNPDISRLLQRIEFENFWNYSMSEKQSG